MQELDVSNVRELEDFLINECMYVVSILLSLSHHLVVNKQLACIKLSLMHIT